MELGTERKNDYNEHVTKCSYEAFNGSSLQQAASAAYTMIYLDKTVQCYSRHDRNTNIEEIFVDFAADRRELEKGWDSRPTLGKAFWVENM